MNRDIKFRAWDESRKIMHYDFQWMQSGNNGNDWVVFTSEQQPIMNDAVKNPFFSQQLKKMQFTGLQDKNGKDIYEGDLLEYEYNRDTKTTVKFVEAVEYDETTEGIGFSVHKSMGYSIIGNIYESKELILQ